MKNNNTTSEYLNPRESQVIARLSYEKIEVITRAQFDSYFDFPSTVGDKVIFRLRKKGIFIPIKKGVYFYSPIESGPAGRNINEFLIPSILFPKGNYYIGYSTMYNYYGFTDQIFQEMCILNTTRHYIKVIGKIRFRMIKILPERMYGLERINVRNKEVIVSDRERTLLDLIYFYKPVGGLRQALKILKYQIQEGKINVQKLIKYISLFPNISTRKRIGFVLEKCGLSSKILEPLAKSIKGSSLVSLYDLKSRKGRIDKKWGIIENVTSG